MPPVTSTANRNRIRVAGSGFTVFTWQNQPIAFAQQISHTAPQGVAGPVAIHPMDEPYPVQVVTPAAASMGTLVLRLYEFYGSQVWERLGASIGGTDANPGTQYTANNFATGTGSLRGAIDLVDIFIKIASHPGDIQIVKYIRPPIIAGSPPNPYTQEFHGCVITNVADAEEINVGTMEITKDITVAYTYSTRGGVGSSAWNLRHGATLGATSGYNPYLTTAGGG